ncbi:class D sortase [Virgibacillus salexigens]|uniref:class D sortase n=1 Tax=Virgibacillus salexigens TaxID=61016 RepID=UPI00190CE99D|nr:class D sortase [Virgibacillus salexigens]
MNKFALLLISIGFVFLCFGGYQWYTTEKQQEASLTKAKDLVKQPNSSTTSLEKDNIKKAFTPAKGETAGILHIPKLEADLPIVEGTDEDELEKGVGHYEGTAYPKQKDQIVLSGHRDTVFRRMGELTVGDHLTIQVPYGDFTYRITDTKVVDADNRSIIMSTAPKEVLTLTTCYPFSYVGNAPDRYIITAIPINN